MTRRWRLLFLALALAMAAPVHASPGRLKTDAKKRMAVATFATNEEQVRAIAAMEQSIRDWSGGRCLPIYVVSPDPSIIPPDRLSGKAIHILKLELERSFLDYPLAIKAFAAAQIEKKAAAARIDTLIWLDPGVIVLKSLDDLVLGRAFDAAVRPVTLVNTIGIPPQTSPTDYWEPIYIETGLDYLALPSFETIVDCVRIQPYFNCEVFSFDPRLGIAGEWSRLLSRFLKDVNYQRTVCTTFLRRLFLHQAVLSAVIASRIRPERIKPLPLASSYPFSQHEKLPRARQASVWEELSVVIFDRTWQQDGNWLERIPAGKQLRDRLQVLFQRYLLGRSPEDKPGQLRSGGSPSSRKP